MSLTRIGEEGEGGGRERGPGRHQLRSEEKAAQLRSVLLDKGQLRFWAEAPKFWKSEDAKAELLRRAIIADLIRQDLSLEPQPPSRESSQLAGKRVSDDFRKVSGLSTRNAELGEEVWNFRSDHGSVYIAHSSVARAEGVTISYAHISNEDSYPDTRLTLRDAETGLDINRSPIFPLTAGHIFTRLAGIYPFVEKLAE